MEIYDDDKELQAGPATVRDPRKIAIILIDSVDMPSQKNVCFLGMYRTKRSLQILRQCVCMFTIK